MMIKKIILYISSMAIISLLGALIQTTIGILFVEQDAITFWSSINYYFKIVFVILLVFNIDLFFKNIEKINTVNPIKRGLISGFIINFLFFIPASFYVMPGQSLFNSINWYLVFYYLIILVLLESMYIYLNKVGSKKILKYKLATATVKDILV